MSIQERGTFQVQVTTTRPPIMVSADGRGVVSHAGSRLLADLADATTLTAECSQALDGLRGRARHDPGRVLVDLAVAIADGAETISDIAVLADQPALFGPVASDSTCWRLLDALTDGHLATLGAARARAREVAWAQRAETTVSRATSKGPPFCHQLGTTSVVAGCVDRRAAVVGRQCCSWCGGRPPAGWGVVIS